MRLGGGQRRGAPGGFAARALGGCVGYGAGVPKTIMWPGCGRGLVFVFCSRTRSGAPRRPALASWRGDRAAGADGDPVARRNHYALLACSWHARAQHTHTLINRESSPPLAASTTRHARPSLGRPTASRASCRGGAGQRKGWDLGRALLACGAKAEQGPQCRRRCASTAHAAAPPARGPCARWHLLAMPVAPHARHLSLPRPSQPPQAASGPPSSAPPRLPRAPHATHSVKPAPQQVRHLRGFCGVAQPGTCVRERAPQSRTAGRSALADSRHAPQAAWSRG